MFFWDTVGRRPRQTFWDYWLYVQRNKR